MSKNIFLLLLLSLLAFNNKASEIQNIEGCLYVDPMIQSNMVIQRNSIYTIEGEGITDMEVTVDCSWNIKKYSTKIDSSGKWAVSIETPKAGGPHTITITSSKTDKIKKFTNILSGDVWLCAGQSNMQWIMKDSQNGAVYVANSTNPNIRLFNVERVQSKDPLDTTNTVWSECNPQTISDFSAVAYFFAQELVKEMDIPIGVINASWGSTAIETWIERSVVMNNAEFRNEQEPRETAGPDEWGGPYRAGDAYNGMIYPLRRVPITGVIWYQGENNYGSKHYEKLLVAMVDNWRKLFCIDFDFFVSQTCPYKREWSFKTTYANSSMRYMQLLGVNNIKNAGISVNDDIADIEDIHPKNKLDVGERLAWVVLSKKYKKNAFDSKLCPTYESSTINGSTITVNFNNVANGLKTRDGEDPTMFEIAGDDKVFYKAKAVISNNSVIVSSPNVVVPKYIRLGWSYVKITNLCSMEGLPVTVFKNYDFYDAVEEGVL